MNISIPTTDPIELIEMETSAISPLVSKCQIKVCYVGDKPNRNHSIITKEVAKKMAPSLRGSVIVGHYSEPKEDFQEHDKQINISNGEFTITDTTVPYGFVDINAPVWFQKFMDGNVEHEYLMTEGYLWTGQFPECQRVIDKGNNQSMELDENPENLDAYWTKDAKGKPQFFIINEAIISKLCILGEDIEPCFEGAQITKAKVQFSFDDNFKARLFRLMEEIKENLSKGGETKPMFTNYAVEIGDTLWTALCGYIWKQQADGAYRLLGVFEEEDQKFGVFQHRETTKLYRLNFIYNETDGFKPAEEGLVEVSMSFEPQFSLEDIDAFDVTFSASAEPEAAPEPQKENGVEDKKVQYNLDEIEEYIELQSKFSSLASEYNILTEQMNTLEAELKTLREFKQVIEKEQKEAMIAKFYMLSDTDKKDVLDNIDTYSLDDIEAKLSVICVRNKVSFAAEIEEKEELDNKADPTTFNLGSSITDDAIPAWVSAVRSVSKNMN